MTTQTSLSAATRAQRDNSVRNSSFQPPAPSFQKLIANLELEFHLTQRKLSPLRISNRKFFAVFHLTAQLCPRPSSSSLPASSLEGMVAVSSISNPGHRPMPLVYPESRRVYPESRRACPESRRAQPHPRKLFFTNHKSRVTNHGFLIYGRAIRIRRNPFKNNILEISNRR